MKGAWSFIAEHFEISPASDRSLGEPEGAEADDQRTDRECSDGCKLEPGHRILLSR